jgi:glycosyltransferase involved in cell wall biosynthesis
VTLDIMMPFYGHPDHFRLAVESVLAQDSDDWRLTIIDDVYPDVEPGRWAAAIDDPRVTYLRNEENLRPSRNYNKAIGIAQSEWLTIMGCDDLMTPRYVSRVLDLIALFPDADLVQPGVRVIDGDGAPHDPLADRVKRRYVPKGARPLLASGEPLATSLLRGNWTYFPSLVWRRSRIAGGFRTDLDVVQDIAMIFGIVADGGGLVIDDEVVFQYRRHARSLSATTGADGSKFAQERVFFAEAAARADALGWRRTARAARWHVSSRLNAMSELPGALAPSSRLARRNLLRHAFGGL